MGRNIKTTFGALHVDSMLQNIAKTHNSLYILEYHFQTTSSASENSNTGSVLKHAAAAPRNHHNIDDNKFDCAPQACAFKKKT